MEKKGLTFDKTAFFLTVLVDDFFGVEDQVSYRSGEDEEAQNAQTDEEQIKIAVVSLSNAIADPWTMMVESKSPLRAVF